MCPRLRLSWEPLSSLHFLAWGLQFLRFTRLWDGVFPFCHFIERKPRIRGLTLVCPREIENWAE